MWPFRRKQYCICRFLNASDNENEELHVLLNQLNALIGYVSCKSEITFSDYSSSEYGIELYLGSPLGNFYKFKHIEDLLKNAKTLINICNLANMTRSLKC